MIAFGIPLEIGMPLTLTIGRSLPRSDIEQLEYQKD